MSFFESIVSFVDNILWNYFLIFGLLGIGIYFSISLKFLQVFRFDKALKQAFSGVFKKQESREGSMSSFQAFATSIAAQIGTGNLAGTATAIAAGGPGAIFWMWVSAFFGMATIFVEATLAQKFRETSNDGQLVGGPAYYIKNGLKSKALASFYACSIILALGFVGNMVQANSLADAVYNVFPIPKVVIGIVLAVLAGLIFIGGIKRIASFAEMVVPVMALFYILGTIAVMIIYRSAILSSLQLIITSAFSTHAVTGGAMGVSMKMAVRYGIARGLFSNEAGMGSTPNSHAVADVKHPVEQGLLAMAAVFIDTALVCTSTALVILVTGAYKLDLHGVSITQEGFGIAFGKTGHIFLAVCLISFAFTTLIGWYYFGENNIRFLFNNKRAIKVYQLMVLSFIIVGSFQRVDLVWNVADMVNGIMVIPNLIGIFLLFKFSKELLNDYDYQRANNISLNYKYEHEKK